MLPMPDSLTDSQRKDSATQLLIKYKSGALVTQFFAFVLEKLTPAQKYLTRARLVTLVTNSKSVSE